MTNLFSGIMKQINSVCLVLIFATSLVYAQGSPPGRLVVSLQQFTSDDIRNRKTVALVDPQTRCMYLGIANFENNTGFLNESQNWCKWRGKGNQCGGAKGSQSIA